MNALVIGTCRTIGENVVKTLPEVVALSQIPNITAFITALKSGATASQAARLATTTTSVVATSQRASVALGTGLASSMEGVTFANAAGQTALAGVKSGGMVLSKFAAGMAGLGCVIAFGDCVFSWVNGNPKRSEAKALIKQIDESMKEICDFRIKNKIDEYRVVSFKNQNSGKYLDVKMGKFELGNPLWQFSKNNTRAQQFYVEYLDEKDGEWDVRIHCYGKEKYSIGDKDGKICIVPKEAGSGKFKLVRNKDDTFFIERNGKVFDVCGESTYDKAEVLYYQKNNQKNQKWIMIDS